MVYGIEQLQSVQDSMRPWVYQLVEHSLAKAIFDDDRDALNAFRYVCDETILFTKSDVEQFEVVRDRLQHSPHRDYYINKIHEAFTAVYVEGFYT
jgi:hypothetical protein